MMFVWEHGKGNVLNFIVNFEKSVDTTYGYSGHMICQSCEGNVEQSYICQECGTIHLSEGNSKKDAQERKKLRYKTDTLLKGMKTIIGKIDKRKDDDTKLVYSDTDKKNYLETHTTAVIRVVAEIKKEDMMDNIEFLDSPYEIYNNEDDISRDLIPKIHNFCNKENVVLVATFGYKDKERCCFIVSSRNKLLLFVLRDGKKIKNPVQIGLNERVNEFTEKVNALTESTEPTLYKEFLNKIRKKEKIEKPKAVKEEKIQIIEVPFLNGY